MEDDSRAAARRTFAAYLSERIQAIAHLKDDAQIAREIGYEGPRIIQLFRSGEARVPLDKIPDLARALEVDPTFLVHLWMTSHLPACAELVGPPMSANEAELLKIVREASQHSDPPISEEKRRQLRAIFNVSVTRN